MIWKLRTCFCEMHCWNKITLKNANEAILFTLPIVVTANVFFLLIVKTILVLLTSTFPSEDMSRQFQSLDL